MIIFEEFPATNQRGLIVFLGGLFYNVGTNLGNLLGMNILLGQNLLALMGFYGKIHSKNTKLFTKVLPSFQHFLPF